MTDRLSYIILLRVEFEVGIEGGKVTSSGLSLSARDQFISWLGAVQLRCCCSCGIGGYQGWVKSYSQNPGVSIVDDAVSVLSVELGDSDDCDDEEQEKPA